tara:strand:+ start:1516 stop:2436 length:921 start_codon:yes stop_codon:yes gene_type:complete
MPKKKTDVAVAQKTNVELFRDAVGRDDMKSQIAAALPQHMTPERMIRVAITAIQTNPDLQECSWRSMLGCVVEASQLGLEPGGVIGHAYLVPYNNRKTGYKEAQLMIGYKGLIDLARRSGDIGRITAEVVYENDKFVYTKGLDPTLVHEPAMSGDPGDIIAAYATAQLKDGTIQFHVMPVEEIHKKHRKRSQAAKQKGSPWDTDPEWMYKKTVLRQLCKLLPCSIEAQNAFGADELRDIGEMHGNQFVAPPTPAPETLGQLEEALDAKAAEPAAEAPPASGFDPEMDAQRRAAAGAEDESGQTALA